MGDSLKTGSVFYLNDFYGLETCLPEFEVECSAQAFDRRHGDELVFEFDVGERSQH